MKIKDSIQELNETNEMVKKASLKLTHLNLQYYRILRELDTTKEELRRSLSNLIVIYHSEIKKKNSVMKADDLKRVDDAYNTLYEGVADIKSVLKRMHTFSKHVDKLMEINDHLEECLYYLNPIDVPAEEKKKTATKAVRQ